VNAYKLCLPILPPLSVETSQYLNNKLFDPPTNPENENTGKKILRVVGKILAKLFLAVVVAPIGTAYHFTESAYNMVKSLGQKDEDKVESQAKAGQHFSAFKKEGLATALLGATAGLAVVSFGLSTIPKIITLVAALASLVGFALTTQDYNSSSERSEEASDEEGQADTVSYSADCWRQQVTYSGDPLNRFTCEPVRKEMDT
jgi:hypothetical protein